MSQALILLWCITAHKALRVFRVRRDYKALPVRRVPLELRVLQVQRVPKALRVLLVLPARMARMVPTVFHRRWRLSLRVIARW